MQKELVTELPLRSKCNFRVIREMGSVWKNGTSEQVQTRLDICFHVAVAQRFTSVCWVFSEHKSTLRCLVKSAGRPRERRGSNQGEAQTRDTVCTGSRVKADKFVHADDMFSSKRLLNNGAYKIDTTSMKYYSCQIKSHFYTFDVEWLVKVPLCNFHINSFNYSRL